MLPPETSRSRNRSRRIAQRSWLWRITLSSTAREPSVFSRTQAITALRSSMPCSSKIQVRRSSPASLAAIRSGTGSMSLATVTFITIRPPAARREAGADGTAGLGIEFIGETESRYADVDRDAVVIHPVIEHETAKVG